MTEVTLVKRLLIFAAVSLFILSAAACTREKPPAVEPTIPVPTVVGQVVSTPAVSPTGGGAATATSTLVLPPAVPSSPAVNTPVVVTTAAPTSTNATAVPTVAPTGAATAVPPTGGTEATTYTVQLGDTLYSIASRYNVTVQQLQAANPGINPNALVPGSVLNIPASTAASGSATATPMGYATAVPSTGGTTTTTAGACPSRYTVQRGEWFYAIARKCGVTVSALEAANPGCNPNVLYPGQVLNIPGAGTNPPPPPDGTTSSYTVKPGDTLYGIAVRFGKTVYALQIANHLASPNWIYPGQVLIIP